jgi:hypothetical protein
MKHRKDVLGDDGPSAPEYWDPIWQNNRVERHKDVHIFIALNAASPSLLEEAYAWLRKVTENSQGGVVILGGNVGDDNELLDYQDVKIVIEHGKPTAKEHFGYTDGIGDPVFEGMPGDSQNPNGRGKQMEDGSWAPLATGEFLLGHIDEAKDIPVVKNCWQQNLSGAGATMARRWSARQMPPAKPSSMQNLTPQKKPATKRRSINCSAISPITRT